MALHNEIGKKGEQESIKYLLSNNYLILENNYRFDRAEIDIIAQKEQVVVFIEVKTRSKNKFGNPEEFLSEAQQKRIFKAAKNYIETNNIETPVRFDVISIVKNQEIKHIEDAFYPID